MPRFIYQIVITADLLNRDEYGNLFGFNQRKYPASC